MKPRILMDGRPAQRRPRGMGIYALRLLPALVAEAADFEMAVALDRTAGPDPWPSSLNVERIWGQGQDPVRWEQISLGPLARRCGAALLHCTANSSPWRPAVPQVVTIHDTIFLRSLWAMRRTIYPRQLAAYAYYRFGIGPAARQARVVLTDSIFSQSEITRRLHIPADRIRVVPLAIPHPARPLPWDRVDAMLQSRSLTKPYVLALGALDPRKNTENVVRAFVRLPRDSASCLVLAGFEMAERSAVPELIRRLGATDRVRILGYLPEDELTALFQGAAAFVYPTRAEGFGLPVLQAFSMGVPVITSRAGSIPEVAGAAAIFVDPEDPCQITQALVTLLADATESHRLALAGHRQAQKFTWAQTARLTLEAYHQALAAGKALQR